MRDGNGVGNGGHAGTLGTDSRPVGRPKEERLDVGADLQLASDEPQLVEDGEGQGRIFRVAVDGLRVPLRDRMVGEYRRAHAPRTCSTSS